MASVVYYRFKSQKEPSRILFDGTGISVFDLKREILLTNKLDSTADTFELRLTNPDTNEIYVNDSEVIPRSTSVLVRRIPVRTNARDSAVRYVSGSMVVNAKNAARREEFKAAGSTAATAAADNQTSAPKFTVGGEATEEDMINAMFQAQGEQWQKTQEEMETKAPVYAPRNFAPAGGEKEPPPGYICHRCGQKGHYISHCPTLNDANWEAKRVRRTTGIPKSMLRTVEKPADDDTGSYLMDADGQYVVAVADDKSWKDFQKRQLLQTAKAKRAVPDELQDPITHQLMVDPVTTPCCQKTYSDQSIQNALIGSEFKCPNCETEDVYIDQLTPNEEMAKKIHEFNHQDDEPDEDLKRSRPDSGSEPASDAEGLRSKRKKQDDDDEYLSDDEKSDEDKGKAAPVGAMPVFPFMFPPFFMPGMVPPLPGVPGVPGAPVAPNRTLRPYTNTTARVEDYSDSESSESEGDQRARRGRR